MRTLLTTLFLVVLACMLWVTVSASLERGVFEAARQLWPDPWFRATLADAYLGFLTVYVWVAYRERTFLARLLWFLLFMILGNIAIAVYVLIQLARLDRGASVERLLLRKDA